MFQSYVKIAWRNIWRNTAFSVTNLLGLSIGITCTILIFLWVQDELTYDKFHANYNGIYKIMANRDFNNQMFTDENMVLPLDKYTYRISISIWLFAIVGVIVLLLTLVVVSLNTMRAATANPVKSLRTE